MMNNFTRMRLEKEKESFQRLFWILEMKKQTLPGLTRNYFNKARDEQITLITSEGVKFQEICNKVQLYKALRELVSD